MTTEPGAPGEQAGPVELRWLEPGLPRAVETWRDVRLEMLRVAPEAFGSRYEDHLGRDLTEWAANLATEGLSTVVAVGPGGDAVGAARLMALPGSEDLPELVSMYVAPSHRGTGLSRRIVEAVAQRAEDTGHTALHLHVMVDNAPARKVYERCGFTSVSEPFRASPDDPADQRLEVRMERRLRSVEAVVGTWAHD
ncbi:GNAT family N-acetyltransferase [Kytococcus sedentarius]|uniref:GNAT family N-acetyltransferase n=1 Tax=Kytococcus sedentarius TaxID=1276 RepID=UPI0035BC185A